MSEAKSVRSQSTSSSGSNGAWTGRQAYLLAVFCLLLGVALGYLFRGSASTATAQAAASTTTQPGSVDVRQQPDANAQAVLAQAAAPLLEAVNRDPKDFDSLVKLGNLFYDGKAVSGGNSVLRTRVGDSSGECRCSHGHGHGVLVCGQCRQSAGSDGDFFEVPARTSADVV